MRLAAIAVVVVAALIAPACAAKRPWSLSFACEADEGQVKDSCSDESPKEFSSKQEAVDWAKRNPQYVPLDLSHDRRLYYCSFEYIWPDSQDQLVAMQKKVECVSARKVYWIVW